jgi:hypothetical protein
MFLNLIISLTKYTYSLVIHECNVADKGHFLIFGFVDSVGFDYFRTQVEHIYQNRMSSERKPEIYQYWSGD